MQQQRTTSFTLRCRIATVQIPVSLTQPASAREAMQVLVVGAGIVGLAIARGAALAEHEVIVAEATKGVGNGVSSRNSEVIHAGMYYPTGSRRAYHCPRGRRLLY